jgi:ABC-type dipeptide/oligopeptide/nickel transport system permease component
VIRDLFGIAFSLLMVVGEIAGDALDKITGHSPEEELARIRHDLGLDEWTDGTS